MKIFYSDQPLTLDESKESIFLAGPTPRRQDVMSWRPEAIRILESWEYDGQVLIPERLNFIHGFDYNDQVEWEYKALNDAYVIVFWVPRDLAVLPGFITNVEFGRYVPMGRAVYGRPDEAPGNRYLDWFYKKHTGRKPAKTLEDTLLDALTLRPK